jgi:hypothetical protein
VRQAQPSYRNRICLLTAAFPLLRSLMRQIRLPTHGTAIRVQEVRQHRTLSAQPTRSRFAHAQHSIPTSEHISPTHTVLSEPKTDVTTMHDTYGRVLHHHVPAHPQAASASTTTTNGRLQTPQPLSAHTSATLIDNMRTCDDQATALHHTPLTRPSSTHVNPLRRHHSCLYRPRCSARSS